jgi:hypothetical protein
MGDSSKTLKRDDTVCRRKGYVFLHIWKDKREVRTISTVCNGTIGEVSSRRANLCISVQDVPEGC